MPRDYTIEDDFGRRTKFRGTKLVAETTDAPHKPQWLEVNVWRTEAGNFVVQRITKYRVRHVRETCTRADGYELRPATPLDTYACTGCNRGALLEGGFGQTPRITVEPYRSPEEMIEGFRDTKDGRYSNLSRAILAEISDQDDRVDALWNNVVVP